MPGWPREDALFKLVPSLFTHSTILCSSVIWNFKINETQPEGGERKQLKQRLL